MFKTIALLLLLCTPSFADDITKHITMSDWDIPGSTITRYEGIRGRILRETSRRIEREYRNQLRDFEQEGAIDYIDYLDRNLKLSMDMNDLNNGNLWWKKNLWWQYLPESKGGAPEEKKIYTVGKTYKIIDFGPMIMTNAGDVRFKTYSAKLDLKKEEDFPDYVSGTEWIFTVSPSARFSPSELLNNFEESFRSIGVRLRFLHRVRNKPIVQITVAADYNFRRNDLRFNFDIVFLQW